MNPYRLYACLEQGALFFRLDNSCYLIHLKTLWCVQTSFAPPQHIIRIHSFGSWFGIGENSVSADGENEVEVALLLWWDEPQLALVYRVRASGRILFIPAAGPSMKTETVGRNGDQNVGNSRSCSYWKSAERWKRCSALLTLTLDSVAVCICTICFNIRYLCILFVECVFGLRMILRINNDYLHKQH